MTNDNKLAYVGIEKVLNADAVLYRICNNPSFVDSIELTIHIDGLPLYKSLQIEFWPILEKVFNAISIIAIYCDTGNPVSSVKFLPYTKKEIDRLQEDGFTIRADRYLFHQRMLLAPKCAGHNGYNNCHKCWI